MSKIKILLVEDEAVTAMDIKSNLVQFGYEVVAVVANGEEAVRKTSELLPDLILMDITLAGPMNGVQTAAAILQSHQIPIIYLTAHTDQETLDRAKLTEPFGYLPKPCFANTLIATIEMALYKSAADAARRKAEAELKELAAEQKILLDQLGKSEERYRTVANFTHDWEFWLGPEEGILYCSPSCQRITGYPVADFEKDPALIRRIVHPDDMV